jgi:CBS domain containing-hemolysin-like protein
VPDGASITRLEALGFVGGAALLFALQTAYAVLLVAVTALSRVALRRLAAEGGVGFGALESLRDPSSSARLSTSLARPLALLGGALLVVLLGQRLGWSSPGVAGVAATALLGVLLLEFVVARSVALWDPKRALRATAFLVRPACLLLFPVVRPLNLLLVRLEGSGAASVEELEEEQEEDVEAYIEVGEREGILEANAGAMMRSIVDLDETCVREIMTPRPDIVALPREATLAEARRVLIEAGHSRIPVYRRTIDDVIGVLHARDVLRAWRDAHEQATIDGYLREAMFVPETMSVADLLAEMRVRTHIAIVVDEYGGVSGLVTLEDLLEEIVGEIRDEHDEPEEAAIREEGSGLWVINAASHVEELERLFDLDLGERDFDTVGGLVVASFGRVPSVGESIEAHGLLLHVLKADRRRILQVRVSRMPRVSEAGVRR